MQIFELKNLAKFKIVLRIHFTWTWIHFPSHKYKLFLTFSTTPTDCEYIYRILSLYVDFIDILTRKWVPNPIRNLLWVYVNFIGEEQVFFFFFAHSWVESSLDQTIELIL
jgi:hypothetical protein